MTRTGEWKPRQLSQTQWFWFLLFIGLLTRIPMLNVAKAETTDGILSLTYFSPSLVDTPRFCILPGYSVLLWLGQSLGADGILWGRILAAAAGLLFLIPLWKFAARWVSTEMAGMICLFALFSPLLWQWSLKVMADTLFLFFFWWCLERLTTASIDRNEKSWLTACLAGALAALVRPEGFLLLPWIIAVGKPLGFFRRERFFLLFWLGPLFFLKEKILTILIAYREGLGLTSGPEHVAFPFVNFMEHLYAYMTQPFFVFTPLLYLFAILGTAKMFVRNDPVGGSFRRIVLQVYFLVLVSRLVPTTYQDRHMLPFLPVILVAAGYHLETFLEQWRSQSTPLRMMLWKNGLITLCLCFSALYSSGVLIGQYDSFGDIKRSAEFLKTLPRDAVIYSDEIPKTQYWSGRSLRLLTLPFNPQPGDYLVLHSFYTQRLRFVDENLWGRHGAVQLRQDHSMVVPLLTDLMEDPSMQNRTVSTAYRFQPQFFLSLVYRIAK